MKIAILDSGITTDNAGKCRNIISVLNDDGKDQVGHGDYVLQCILRVMCETTEIDSIKVLDSSGRTDFKSIIKGLETCIESDCDVINMSFSFFKEIDNGQLKKIKKLFETARKRDKIIFCSTRNKNCDFESMPASLNGVIGVCGSMALNENEYYYDKNRSIQILASSKPIIIRTINGKRCFFSGNSKATAIMSGWFSHIKQGTEEDSESVLVSNAVTDKWTQEDVATRLETDLLKSCEIDKYSDVAQLIHDYKKNEGILGPLNRHTTRGGGSRNVFEQMLNAVDFVENRMSIEFDDNSIAVEDFFSEEKLIYAMEKKWRAKENCGYS